MTPSTRQSGAVHLMFVIVVLIIGLVGWGLWFGQKTENEELVLSAQDNEEKFTIEQNKNFHYREALKSIVTAVGGIPTEVPESVGEAAGDETYKKKIEASFIAPIQKAAKAAHAFAKGDESGASLFNVNVPFEALVTKLEQENERLKTQLAATKSEKAAAEKANDELVTEHNRALAAKNEAIAELRNKNAAKEQQLEGQKDQLSASLKDAADKLDNAVTEHTKEITALRDKTESLDRDVRDIKLVSRTSRERNKPDGQVTMVNYKRGTCYINIGTKHGLRRGTRFRTYGFRKGKVKEYHGYIVVRDTERDRALCALENGARPSSKDYVTSPHFDSDGAKKFYFLGNLPGRFNNQTATKILGQYGMNVAEKFGVDIDFLVLGANPEPPEEGEEADPSWFKKTGIYSDAVRWGIEMIRAEDLETYLKY